MKKSIIYLLLACLLTGCYRASTQLEPHLALPTHPKEIQREKKLPHNLPANFSRSPFPVLSAEESQEDWGKEYRMALAFAEEFDLYRAITGFKRALFLLPSERTGRQLEIEYSIALAYYLGKKYVDAAFTIENGGLLCMDASTFPAYQDLLLVLYDCYKQLGRMELAEKVLARIEQRSSTTAAKLSLLSAIESGQVLTLAEEGICPPACESIYTNYLKEAKSVRKAELLNAIFPGSGYWYVGQKETAVTAFVVNTLFLAAAGYFFDQGNIAAGVITLSLESGWYFGGIYGAGLATKAYNEQLYEVYAGRYTQREQLYPLMMLKFTF